jgi:hypothetical protein
MFRPRRAGKYRITTGRHHVCRIAIDGIRPLAGFDAVIWFLLIVFAPVLVAILELCQARRSPPATGEIPRSAIIVFLSVLTPFALWLLWRLLRALSYRQEVVSVAKDVLVIREVGLLKDRVERCPVAEIRNLQYSTLGKIRSTSMAEGNPEIGSITFDACGLWHSFGLGLSLGHCQELVEILKAEHGLHVAEAPPTQDGNQTGAHPAVSKD